MEKCQRCQKKEYETHCFTCESFNNLCLDCDSYLHNLPSKQNHKRVPKKEVNYISKESNNGELENDKSRGSNSSFRACEILKGKFFSSNTYSKEYLNEIKEVFRKEKNELEFKNKNLENTLKSLEKYGFNPIKIPAVWGWQGINYMNGIIM